MRLLIVNYEYPPIGGGAGYACYKTCEYLAKQEGLDISLMFGTSYAVTVPQIDGIRYIPVRYHRRSIHDVGAIGLLDFILKAGPLLYKILRAEHFDLIHYHFSVPTGLLSFLHRNRIDYIISFHGGDVPGHDIGEYQMLHRFLGSANRAVVRNAAAVCAVSNALATHSKSIFGISRITIIPNGAEMGELPERAIDKGEVIRLIAVCRLVYCKRLDQLLRALVDIDKATLEIIGTGPEAKKLRRLVIDMGIAERVVFSGALSNEMVRRRLRQAHVFVLPSANEGMSLAIMEAMAEGLPIIGGNGGGTPGLVSPGVNGFLVNPDNIGQIRQAISHFIGHPEDIASFGMQSWDIAQSRFNWGAVADAYRKVYDRIKEKPLH